MKVPRPEQYQVNLHILSPIHIGTGEDLDPFSYVIRNKTLLFIDMMKWFETFENSDQRAALMEAGDFTGARSFIAERFNDSQAVKYAVPVLSKKLLNTYRRVIREKDPKNQVLISPMAREPVGARPYLPGSAIKGSIRTAIGNQFVKKARVTKQDAHGREDYNKKIFGPINKDPMRWLKISDVNLQPPGSVIVEAKEYSKNPSKQLTPKNYFEAAISGCQVEHDVVYPLRFMMAPFELHRQKIDAAFLINALNSFYVPKYEQEYRTFYSIEKAKSIRSSIAGINTAVSDLENNEALIRIGHFSHIECATFDGVRNPSTRRGRDGRPLPYGTTRTLANGLLPFGWAKLDFVGLKSKYKPPKIRDIPLEKGAPGPECRPNFDEIKKEIEHTLSDLDKSGKTDNIERAGLSPQDKAIDRKTAQETTVEDMPKTIGTPKLTKLDKLLRDLSVIGSTDMGRLGTIVQRIEDLDDLKEKAAIAKAIKEKISPKAFKKHKKRDYLMKLIEDYGK